MSFTRSEIEILEVERRIRNRVKKQMEKTQKEYYLNEQKRAIQKELGEKDEFKNELQELEENPTKKLSQEARDKVEKELKKLKMMSPMSGPRRPLCETTLTGCSSCPGMNTRKISWTFKMQKRF